MQSTGHSSMQALSLTSMHGSAITYVTDGSTSPGDPRDADHARRAFSDDRGGLLAADVRHLHLRFHPLLAAGLAGALLGVTVCPPGPAGADLLAQRLVTVSASQRAPPGVPCT